MREDSVIDPAGPDDDLTLRPRRLDEFIGQTNVKERLRISVEAARTQARPLDHVLLSGPPGLGKTTLAGIIAQEMGAEFRITSGPALERPGDLASILSGLDHGSVFFIDEIHRLPRAVEEVLYPAMEDFQLDIVLGKGPAAQSIRLDLPHFTLVGATTRKGKVTAPLRDRFGIEDRLDYYTDAELLQIVVRSARILEAKIDDDSALIIAAARSDGRIDTSTTLAALSMFEIDQLGLDKVDRAILEAVILKFGGGPVGLSTLAIAVGEEPETVEDAYEPFLLQIGLLQRTPRGRVATESAYRHLGVAPPSGGQSPLEFR
jgi:Holliday junction DNA helicase RuvB